MSDLSRYPEGPGYRTQPYGETTSYEAARAVAPRLPRQERVTLEAIDALGKASPEEVVQFLERQGSRELLTSIRARCTGLSRRGILRASGTYGKGESGKVRVIRWERDPDYQPPLAALATDGGAANG